MTERRPPNPRRKRRILVALCAGVFIAGMCGLTLEIAVRLSGYANQWIYDPIYVPFPEADDLPYIHKPGLKSAFAQDRVRINTDSLGNRSLISGQTYDAKHEGRLRIAVFGDSLTFGHGLPETADTYCCRLESLLAQGFDQAPQVIYFGASAYSVREMTASLRERALPLKPDIAFMSIIADDLDLNRTPDLDRWGFHHNRRKSGWIDKDSRFKRFLRGFHSIYFIRDHLPRPNFGEKPPPPPVELPEASLEYIQSFLQIAEENEITPYIVILPSYGRRPQTRHLGKRLQELNAPVINLAGITDHLSRKERMVNKYNAHPSAIVHQLIAESLAEFVLKHSVAPTQGESPERTADTVSRKK